MTDEMYLKMILALSEKFFDGWEWQEGDAFLYKEDESEPYSIGYIGTHILTNHKPVGFMDVCFDPFENLSGLRPVPSQEQLQNKILDHWKKTAWCGYTPLSLLSEFRIFVFEKCEVREFIENKTTIIEMLLMFLMNEIYNQKWDGEKWL